MTKYDLKPIVKTFYDALEEGTILGRKCLRCGHIEFPPFLCCNACGGLDTEWVDLTNVRGVVKQALPTKGAFGDPDFRNQHGDYFAVEVAPTPLTPAFCMWITTNTRSSTRRSAKSPWRSSR